MQNKKYIIYTYIVVTDRKIDIHTLERTQIKLTIC